MSTPGFQISDPGVRLGPPQINDGPEEGTVDIGLTSFANVVTTPPDGNTAEGRWTLGYAYRPDAPKHARVRAPRDWFATGSNVVDSEYDAPKLIETVPVLLTLDDEISVASRETRDLDSYVLRMIENYTSKMLERELWTGELADQEGLPNRRLKSPDTIHIDGGADVKTAIARLAQALSDSGPGGGMIHIPMFLALMMPDGLITGNIKETFNLDIVPGAGYPLEDNTIYATQPVNVKLSTAWTSPESLNEAVRPSDNTIRYRAERFGAVDFAGPVFASQVSL